MTIIPSVMAQTFPSLTFSVDLSISISISFLSLILSQILCVFTTSLDTQMVCILNFFVDDDGGYLCY